MNQQLQRNSEHGQTVSAWVMTISVIIGSALIALGVFLETAPLWITGIAISSIGAMVSYVLHQLGYGQKSRQ